MQHFIRRAARCTLAAIFILPLATVQAQSTGAPTYRAGLKSIAVPAPTSDFVELGPDYRVILEPLAPDSNRLIAAFTLSDDAAALRSGAPSGMKQYALVEVMRRAEFSTITPDIYKQIADAMATQFGATLDGSIKDAQDQLNRSLKVLSDNAATVSLDKPIQLGLLFSKADACGFGIIMPVSAKGDTIKMAAAVLVLRLQERVVFVYLYKEYKDEASVRWVTQTAQAWADSILAANKP